MTAGALAKKCGTPVTVASITTASHSAERRTEAQEAVARVVAYMQAEGTRAEGQVIEGEPAEAIVHVARERGADLIVTGSHGRTGLERVFLGSTSERILNETPCAVLVVKAA